MLNLSNSLWVSISQKKGKKHDYHQNANLVLEYLFMDYKFQTDYLN